MKDCIIISMFSKTETSYANYYIDELEKAGKSYDIVYFDRYLNQKKERENELIYSKYCPTGGSKIQKLSSIIDYARFIKKYVKKKKYKTAIVLTTVPGVILNNVLLRDFRGKYIFDIRDYTYENIKLYSLIEEKLIKNSYATVLSSKGFKQFLPDFSRYVITHNISNDFNKQKRDIKLNNESVVLIGFVGSIRYFEENKKLIKSFANDKKFHLDYFGTTTNDCDLEEFSDKNGISNVSFHGAFDNDDKPEIYKGIGIINSIYGIKGLETTTAVPNRFYDAAIYGCPIIVSKRTYLEKLVRKYNLGFAVDIYNDDINKMLNDYIDTFDEEAFEKGCKELLQEVNKDMSKYKRIVKSFINRM